LNDFASSAMLRLIQHGLKRQGIVLSQAKSSALTGAHTPINDKRILLNTIERVGGPNVLLDIGQSAKHVRDDPALTALSLAKSPLDLIQRWQRLEKFVHSRHRTQIEHSNNCSLQLLHYSIEPANPPTSGENFLIYGLLIGLLELIGVAHLSAQVVGMPNAVRINGSWGQGPLPSQVERWQFDWMPGTHKPIEKAIEPSDWISATANVLEADLSRKWSVAQCASALNSTSRTLQRRLAENTSDFNQVLLGCRLAHAAKLLTNSDQSPAQIGYGCGFSDQAHFSRAFKKHTALSPVQYREQFAPSLQQPRRTIHLASVPKLRVVDTETKLGFTKVKSNL
jgi:AraC-like DNA-binding protein